MIYTTYFAKLKTLPKDIVPISICAKVPNGYHGLEYKKLAPSYELLSKWKQTNDNDYYIKCYLSQVLQQLEPKEVVTELYNLAATQSAPVKDIALVCYEKSADFCHRHLVSAWLHNNGWASEEYLS